MTPKQLEICQHALGLDQYGQGRSYRNRYVTGPDCDNFKDLQELVANGFVRDHGPQKMMAGMHYFSVTPKGIDYVAFNSPKPPKLTRSQKRYRRYLKSGCCFKSFRDFLIYESKREKEERSVCW